MGFIIPFSVTWLKFAYSSFIVVNSVGGIMRTLTW